MQYHVIGLMSGSSLDGLDIAYVILEETTGKWQFEISAATCISYSSEWEKNLSGLDSLSARDYLLLHSEYGHWLGKQVNDFIESHKLNYRIQLIASHGHTAFHIPDRKMTAQLGDGASIAAETGIRTISDLRSIDIAFGGQGAPVVPIGEKLLFPEYDLFLNLGGIANISSRGKSFIGFDVCPANRVLNMLAADLEKGFDEDGKLASTGQVNPGLLNALNSLDYYSRPFPKSLANEFGTKEVFPIIEKAGLSRANALCTYTEHIAEQIAFSLFQMKRDHAGPLRLFTTGGGAHNRYLISRLRDKMATSDIEPVIPSEMIINFKESLVMALMGTLRWREDINVLHSVTGASKDSINGAIWSV